MNKPRNWDPAELFHIVPLCISIEQVVSTLGLKIAGGNAETIKRWIKS